MGGLWPLLAAQLHAALNAPVDTLRGFALLLLCQSAGEALSRGAHVPLPGPVIGLLLLWALLNVAALQAPVAAMAEPLLNHLSLLFVPVGVGGAVRRAHARGDRAVHLGRVDGGGFGAARLAARPFEQQQPGHP
jgi:hypothetical protein